MAIGTYAELQTAVETWLDRDDGVTTDLIMLFEAHANRTLRVRQMEISDDLTPAGGVADLPEDYLQWRRVTWTGSSRRELEYVNPSYLQAAYPDDSSGYPNVFTIEGETIIIRPTSTTDIELSYFQKIPALSDVATTNWLLTAHPDAYLFGSLCEAQGLNVDFDKMLLWKQRRDEVMAEIERLSAKSRGVGAVRIMGPVV
jgi:hypothetical protein